MKHAIILIILVISQFDSAQSLQDKLRIQEAKKNQELIDQQKIINYQNEKKIQDSKNELTKNLKSAYEEQIDFNIKTKLIDINKKSFELIMSLRPNNEFIKCYSNGQKWNFIPYGGLLYKYEMWSDNLFFWGLWEIGSWDNKELQWVENKTTTYQLINDKLIHKYYMLSDDGKDGVDKSECLRAFMSDDILTIQKNMSVLTNLDNPQKSCTFDRDIHDYLYNLGSRKFRHPADEMRAIVKNLKIPHSVNLKFKIGKNGRVIETDVISTSGSIDIDYLGKLMLSNIRCLPSIFSDEIREHSIKYVFQSE